MAASAAAAIPVALWVKRSFDSVGKLGAPAAIRLGIVHLYIVLVEEPHLSKAFPERYSEYCLATNRYIGFRAMKEVRGSE